LWLELETMRRAWRDEEGEGDWLGTMGDRGSCEDGTLCQATESGGDSDETGSTALTRLVSRAGRDGRRCMAP